MQKTHRYQTNIIWTGNTGLGTKTYLSYERNYIIKIDNKIDILGSSDAAFRGDITKHNPEDLLLASISSCHMLWYLHLCADNGIIVTEYTDHATANMIENPGGGGKFISATLNPKVVITDENQIEKANLLHKNANEKCFIANSCNFPIQHFPTCTAILK